MPGFKRPVLALAAAAAIACVPVLPAAAGVHGFGHLHPWGLGRGLVGAVVGLATLPITIVSAAIAASEPEAPYQAAPGYDGGARGYAPPPAYYAPPAYYSAPRAYYPARAPLYYAPPRAYYTPRTYAPRAYFAARPGTYGGRGVYRSGGYAYPHR